MHHERRRRRHSDAPVRTQGGWALASNPVPTYRLHDTTDDDLGLIEHPAPNVEPATWSSWKTAERRSSPLGSRPSRGR